VSRLLNEPGDFVVQLHRAERAGLHQDLRLNVEGIYKSWAVPKGVPTEAGTKRLAIQTSDHLPSQARFEGTISKKYGKGDIEIWDEGEAFIVSAFPENIRVILYGSKLEGSYFLKRLDDNGGKKWLIWKEK